MNTSRNGLPRWVEAAFALVALILAAPVLAVVAIAVAFTSPGPVLFRHERVGKDGRPFTMLKFRTMYSETRGPSVTASTDARITPVGRIARYTKLDEFPEFWNVLRGDMSLVGPRPECVSNVDLSDIRWQEVLRARPGITDPTTLHLRNEEALLAAAGANVESFYRRFLLPYKLLGYREYLALRTWKTDVAVIWRTIAAVILPARVPPPTVEQIVASSTAGESVQRRCRTPTDD